MGASAKQKQQYQQEEQIFSKGSVVEVSTDEEGFKDAWFVATVIEPPTPSPSRPGPKSKKSPNLRGQKVYVEYKTLYADEKLSKPLRERVHVGFVRPVPPTHENPPTFELNDVVDAYYRDGWWTGVITRVVEDSRFVVTFRNPPDEIEFGVSDIRFHLDWVSGCWVHPQKQKKPGLMYSVGKKVEVSLEKEYVWFPATIVEDPGNGSFLVEHETNPDEPQATVDYPHIRPCPPLLRDRSFILLEKVDAFYDFGWWSGVITKELADSRYVVFFKHTNTEREFGRSELRPHLRWRDGKWFSTSRDVIIPCHEKPEGLVQIDPNDTNINVSHGSLNISESNSEGKKSEEKPAFSSETRENQNEQLSSGHEKSLNVTTSPKKRTRYPPADSGKTLLQPVEKLKKGVEAAEPSLLTCQQDTVASEKQSEGTVSNFDSPPTNSTGANLLGGLMGGDQPSDNPSWGKRTQRKRQKIGEEDNHTPRSKRKPGRPGKLLFKRQQSSSGSKEGSGVRNAAEVVEKECRAKEADISIVLGLECIKMSGSRTGKTRQWHGEELLKLEGDQKQQMNDQSVHSKELRAGESDQKRRRGRPRKVVLVRSLETLVTEQNGNDAKEDVIEKDCITSEVDSLTTTGMVSVSVEGSATPKEFVTHNGDGKKAMDSQPKEKNESGNAMEMSPARMPTWKNDQTLIRQHERHSSKRSKRRMASLNQNSLAQDSSDAPGGETEETCITKEVEMVVEEGLHNMSDDQPLSKWFEEMHSPGTVDGTRVSPARNVEQSTELSERHKVITQNSAIDDEGINVPSEEVVTQSPAVDKSTNVPSEEVVTQSPAVDKNIIVSSEPENLPFVKNTTLWAAVESMEVFQKMPQKPHFRPLLKCKESSREGLAIASMVTFSSAVEKISKLQFNDPRDKIDDILDSLNDLETHGFDVQVSRDRIAKLLSIQAENKKLHDQVMEINSQIVTCNLEKADKDEEIVEIIMQIQELQEKLSRAQLVKEIKDREIASLQKKLLDVEESHRSGRSTFEGLAGGVL